MNQSKIKIVIWSIADVSLYPIAFMASIPVFMNHMGDALFGYWMMINAILVTGQLLNMGLGTATFRNVAKLITLNNHKEISHTISSNIVTSICIGLLAIVFTIAISLGILHADFLHIESHYKLVFIRSIWICIPILILKFIEQILQYSLKAYECFIKVYKINLLSKFGLFAINLGFVLSGNPNIEWMLLANLFFIMLIVILLSIQIKLTNPLLKFSFHVDINRVKNEINFGGWVWLQSLFVIATYQGDRFLVMNFFGPTELAYYGIVSSMFNHIHMCFISIAPWAFPKITKMLQKGEHTPNEYFKFRSYIIIIALCSLWIFSLVNPILFTWWLGAEKYAHIQEYVTLFTAFELFFVFTIIPNIYCNSAGYEKLYTTITIIFTSLNFVGMILGYYFIGTVAGLIWGLILSTIPGMMIQNSLINRKVFKQPFLREVFYVFLPSALFAITLLNHILTINLILILSALFLIYKLYYSPVFHRLNFATLLRK